MEPATIDPQTGELATEWCPNRVRDWYKPGLAPTVACRTHTAPAEAPADTVFEDGTQPRVDSSWNDVFSRARKAVGKIFRIP